MIDFHRPVLSDRAWVTPLLSQFGDDASEAAFGTYYCWQPHFAFEIAQVNDFFVAWSNGGYIFPAGEGDLFAVLRAIREDAKERGRPLRFLFSERFRSTLEAFCPNCFRIEENRANADYLYRVSDLAELPGKPYHAKRNHIARFMREYDYTFEAVSTDEQARECMQLLEDWCSTNENAADYADEHEAIRRAFQNRVQLQLKAGLLRVDGKVIAFAAGEEINSRVFDQHFEKALTEYDGAYAVINHDFMRYCLSDYEWVNREEDMGIEGLRKAKLSYRPDRMVNKYLAELIEA